MARQTPPAAKGRSSRGSLAQSAPATKHQPAAATSASACIGVLPELGENIDQGDLVRMLVTVGARVSEGQPVMELGDRQGSSCIEVPSSVTAQVAKRSKSEEGQTGQSRTGHLRFEGGAAP